MRRSFLPPQRDGFALVPLADAFEKVRHEQRHPAARPWRIDGLPREPRPLVEQFHLVGRVDFNRGQGSQRVEDPSADDLPLHPIDRQVIGLLKPDLQHLFGWTERDYAAIVFSFQLAYAIGLLLSGRVMDRLGTKKGYALAIILWSLAAIAHAFADWFPGLSIPTLNLDQNTGLSVVSDIDDTIKVTQVRDQHQMLLNTFARSFKAVPGMAQHYAALARNPQTRFHYLSSSPIQLLPPLQGFLQGEGFPPGSIHLRESTTLRTLIPGEGESRAHKLSGIARLMEDFPQRRFLLVGDSGELDPEIYGEVARKQGSRIEGIVIRDVTAEGRDAARYAAAFEGVDPATWHILRDGQPWPIR